MHAESEMYTIAGSKGPWNVRYSLPLSNFLVKFYPKWKETLTAMAQRTQRKSLSFGFKRKRIFRRPSRPLRPGGSKILVPACPG